MKRMMLVGSMLILFKSYSQNIGINATGATPVNSAALDIDMVDKGLLIPRIALTASNVFAPVTGVPTVSLLVYNNATAGITPYDVTPGYYYWDGTQWLKLAVGSSSDDWKLLGNAGTNSSINFLGTADDVDLIFRRNNTRAGRLGVLNTSFGVNALNPTVTGTENTAIGVGSLSVLTTGSRNTVVGNLASQNATGDSNTVVGYKSMQSNNGINNVGIGIEAIMNNLGSHNIGIGFQSGQSSFGSNSSSYNVAIGDRASTNATMMNTIAIGKNANRGGYNTTNGTPYSRIAIGENALSNSGYFISTTAIGIGYSALRGNTGLRTIAIGDNSIDGGAAATTSSGQDLIAIGNEVLRDPSNASGMNIGIGNRVMSNIQNGSANVAIGHWAAYNLDNGNYNTILGNNAFNSGAGDNNVGIGAGVHASASYMSTNNVLIGADCAAYSGYLEGCVFIGRNVGNSISIFDDTYNLLMIDNSSTPDPLIYGDFAANYLKVNGSLESSRPWTVPQSNFRVSNTTNSAFFGHYMVASGSYNPVNAGNVNQSLVFSTDGNSAVSSGGLSIVPWSTTSGGLIILENGNVGVNTDAPGFRLQVNGTTACTGNVWTSDQRKKKNIVPLQLNAIEIIKKLSPVEYEWKTVQDQGMEGIQYGFIAQDLEQIVPTMVVTDTNNADEQKAVKYLELLPIYAKAIQEQQLLIEELRKELDQLKYDVNNLK